MGIKLVVVDDAPFIREVYRNIFLHSPFDLIGEAENGEQAIAKAKEEKPDLVLMDVVMPGVNGFQATRAFAKDQSLENIPIIICSTKGHEIDKIWGLRQGARDYLAKPIVAEELLQKISRLN